MKIARCLSIILISLTCCSSNGLAKGHAENVFNNIKLKHWDAALHEAENSGDSALIKIALSQKFLNAECKTNSFEGVVHFLKDNPHWPQYEKLQERAEDYLKDSTNKKTIIHWFGKNKPKTGAGYKYYALAASSAIKDQNTLIPIIKKGWIYGDFTAVEEKNYYNKFSKWLSKNDHIRRIEEQLWRSDITEARRSLYLVDQSHKKAFEAAMLAIQKSSKTEEAFSALGEEKYIPVVLYRYLEYKKTTQPDDSAVALFKKIPKDSAHENEWCKLQLYYAREFIDYQDFTSAYRVASQHFATAEEHLREAEWLCGWLALRFLHKPALALKHFEALAGIAKKPISVAKADYWIARTYDAQKNHDMAAKYYKKASRYPYTFYGQMAMTELKHQKLTLPPSPKYQDYHHAAIAKNEIVRAAKLLVKHSSLELASTYAKAAMEQAKTPEEILLIAEIIHAQGSIYHTVEVAKTASQNHVLIKEYAYPTPYKVKNLPIEEALMYGIIRQESVFNKAAVSTAKAMGLMQLVKDTACRTAKMINEKCDIKRLTTDAQYNIRLGNSQMKALLDERGGSYILAIASYNTTSKNVNKWIKRFGDPRDLKDVYQVIDWLELVPFSETRNYLHRVLEVTQIYRVILKQDNKLRLREDLMRGKRV